MLVSAGRMHWRGIRWWERLPSCKASELPYWCLAGGSLICDYINETTALRSLKKLPPSENDPKATMAKYRHVIEEHLLLSGSSRQQLDRMNEWTVEATWPAAGGINNPLLARVLKSSRTADDGGLTDVAGYILKDPTRCPAGAPCTPCTKNGSIEAPRIGALDRWELVRGILWMQISVMMIAISPPCGIYQTTPHRRQLTELWASHRRWRRRRSWSTRHPAAAEHPSLVRRSPQRRKGDHLGQLLPGASSAAWGKAITGEGPRPSQPHEKTMTKRPRFRRGMFQWAGHSCSHTTGKWSAWGLEPRRWC